MFRAVMLTQWKWTRTVLLLATVVAFAMPLASLKNAAGAFNATMFVMSMQQLAGGYALLAAAIGLLVALAAWQPDHQGRHVYALSLPVSRASYAAMRFGAGALFLLLPVIGLLIGALVVAASDAIPEGLHAYPLALTLRFALASAVSFAVFFAIASSTPKTAGVVLGLIAGLFLAQYVLDLVGSQVNVLDPTFNFLFVKPGVFSVFAGRWMLVDV